MNFFHLTWNQFLIQTSYNKHIHFKDMNLYLGIDTLVDHHILQAGITLLFYLLYSNPHLQDFR